ncbi:hypothetical protein [Ferrimonas senticii]|uniref:hypothetical protein n=1 Tax=Ferrimonas senticii TaxID=394566 RepID=UPI0003F6EB8B|nr:hypothetical protein [Ferrimonas senticii]
METLQHLTPVPNSNALMHTSFDGTLPSSSIPSDEQRKRGLWVLGQLRRALSHKNPAAACNAVAAHLTGTAQ